MGGDLVELAIWIFILAAVALYTWVKKLVEKLRTGEDGKKIDVGAAVRKQIEKYMKAGEDSPMARGFGRTEEDKTPEKPAGPPPEPPALPEAPPVVALARPERPKPAAPLRPTPREMYVSPLRGRFAAASPLPDRERGGRHRKLTRGDLRTAIVNAEILGPPVALRRDYRLF